MGVPVFTPTCIPPKALGFQRPLKLSSGLNHVLLMTQAKTQKKLYAWGDCTGGKIGRTPPMRQQNARCLKVSALSTKGLLDVWAAGNHSFAKQQGLLYAWGLNRDGQLGLGHTKDTVKPELVEFFRGKDVLNVQGGAFHTLFLTGEGRVYGAGCGRDGQLALGAAITQSLVPLELPVKDIELIASGEHFGYAVSREGRIYSWGVGDNYVLANNQETNEDSPFEVDLRPFQGEEVVQIAAGSQHLCFVSTAPHSVVRPGKRGGRVPSKPSKRVKK